jgi:DNA polymerase-3 subunit delta'
MWQVIGQGRAVTLLKQSLAAGRLAHAYLLVGPPHVGKMTLAINIAQALNCEAGEPPCLECTACKKIAVGNHADVRIIGLAQNENDAEAKVIGIDQIKEVQHAASLPPFEGRHKVFIIDGAELLSTEAANCLLKTLEEPVGKVTFILLTINDRRLLPTVVSRCQRLEMPPLSIDKEAGALRESRGITPEKARLLAGLSHGCPGWALQAADNIKTLEQRDGELKRLTEVIKGDNEGRFDYAGQLAGKFSQNRTNVYEVMDTWLNYWRDLMLVKLGGHDLITNIDRQNEMIEIAGGYRLDQIRNFISSIQAAGEQLRQNVNARLALEVLMLDLPTMREGV